LWLTLRRRQYAESIASNGRIAAEESVGEDLERSSVSLINVLTGHVPGGKPQKSVRIVGVSADIRIVHFSNTSIRH
jgi:hypothetical protein